MIIRFWGTRGSIPVSGKEFVKYGGDTTCVEIRTKNDEIIILFENGEKITKKSWKKFNCKGEAYFNMNEKEINNWKIDFSWAGYDPTTIVSKKK